jgi:hypothetical protein
MLRAEVGRVVPVRGRSVPSRASLRIFPPNALCSMRARLSIMQALLN